MLHIISESLNLSGRDIWGSKSDIEELCYKIVKEIHHFACHSSRFYLHVISWHKE